MVREKRGKQKLRETAKEIGIGPATLMRVENGRIPDVATFGKICKWLKADPGTLLGFESSGSPGTVQNPAFSVSAHGRFDQAPEQATVNALAQMVLYALRAQPWLPDPDL
jgi:transcriptional regulator with XRE-family HTH domain